MIGGWTTANVIKFTGFTGSTFTLDNAADPGAAASVGGYKALVYGIQIVEVASVPEPSSTSLIGLGAMAMILRRRR